MQRRVFRHSGGIETVTVRAGTGGRKASQWRTENTPAPPKPAKATGCARCTSDRLIIDKAEAVFKQHKQPPLNTRLPVPDGAPGSQVRRKADSAEARIAACKCQRAPAPAKKPAKAPARTPAPRRATSSTDPYQQVLAHARQKTTSKRKKH